MPPGWGTYDYEYKCKDSRWVFFWYQMFSCSWHLFSFLLAIYLSSFVGHSLLVIFIHDQYGRGTRYFKCFRERFTLHTFVVFLVSSGRCLNLIPILLLVAFLPKLSNIRWSATYKNNLCAYFIKVHSEIPFTKNLYYIEINQSICIATYLTGFYTIQVFTERYFRTDINFLDEWINEQAYQQYNATKLG